MQKAVSLLQPWAQLTVTIDPNTGLAEKEIETRSWPTKYRGRLAIHASKGTKAIKELALQEPFKAALYPLTIHGQPDVGGCIWLEGPMVATPIWLPLGAIIGFVTLVDCIQMTPAWLATVSDKERAFGHYEAGRWAWLLKDPELLAKPIPARGSLGLWSWEGGAA